MSIVKKYDEIRDPKLKRVITTCFVVIIITIIFAFSLEVGEAKIEKEIIPFFQHILIWIKHICYHISTDLTVALFVYFIFERGFEFLTKFMEVRGISNLELIKKIIDEEQTKEKLILYDTFINHLIEIKKASPEDVREFENKLNEMIKDDPLTEVRQLCPLFKAIYIAMQRNKGLKVEILLLHPYSNAAKQRQRDIIHSEGTEANIIPEMIKGLSELYKFYRVISKTSYKDSLLIKIYDSTPLFSLIAFDKINYIAFYGPKRSHEGNRFIIPDSKIGDSLRKQYEEIWDNKDKNEIEYNVGIDKFMSATLNEISVILKNEEERILKFIGDDEFPDDVKYIAFNYTNTLEHFFDSYVEPKKKDEWKWINIALENKPRQIKVVKRIKKSILLNDVMEKFKRKYLYISEQDLNKMRFYSVINDREKCILSSTIEDINEKFRKNNYYYLTGNNINCGTSYFNDWRDLCEIWNDLIIDEHYANKCKSTKKKEGEYANRKRRMIHFKYDVLNDVVYYNFKNKKFKQHVEYEGDVSNEVTEEREFELMEKKEQYEYNRILVDIVKFDAKNMILSDLDYSKLPPNRQVIYGTMHFIRIEASIKKIGYPSLEGFHRDQHEFLALHMIRKSNVEKTGAFTSLKENDSDTIIMDNIVLEDHLDTLYIADENIMHNTTPFKGTKENELECFRDMLIVDFDKENKYEAW